MTQPNVESETSDRRKKGIELMDKLNPKATNRLSKMMEGVAPDMVDMVLDFAYGEVMSREGLDLKTRELCIIASLAAMGLEVELKIHVRKAVHIGVSQREISEVLLQQAVYSGFPRAINALVAAKEVFEEQ